MEVWQKTGQLKPVAVGCAEHWLPLAGTADLLMHQPLNHDSFSASTLKSMKRAHPALLMGDLRPVAHRCSPPQAG